MGGGKSREEKKRSVGRIPAVSMSPGDAKTGHQDNFPGDL